MLIYKSLICLMNGFFWHDDLKRKICHTYLSLHTILEIRIFIAFIVIISEVEYSIVAIVQDMSGTLDIFVELNGLMWTALGALHLDCLRERSIHILMFH